MGKKLRKYSKRSNRKLSLNEDRGEAFWQSERGPRYGFKRKAVAKRKVYLRKKERRDLKEDLNKEVNE